MYNAVICRYHEIATKGNNRNFFENCLAENIRFALKNRLECAVKKVRGRFWVEKRDKSDFAPAELETVLKILRRCYGLESFSPIIKTAANIEEIEKAALDLALPKLSELVKANVPVNFRIRARRSDKSFPLRSQEIEILLVSSIADAFGAEKLKIDLKNADFTIGCEVRDEFAALFCEEFSGPGGLPVGSNPRVLCLLSGGIDSPVASSMLQKRGCPVDFITFHSSPYTPPDTVDKVKNLADILNNYQRGGTLYLCNLVELQKNIRDLCSERNRTVLYRRAMFRIAEKVAAFGGCKALITGESVGQVASQTINNLIAINAATSMLILRPLIGMDKSESIRLAEKLGTFEISKLQVPDSCTVFAPSSPSTSVPIDVAEREEAKIPDYWELIEQIAQDAIETRS